MRLLVLGNGRIDLKEGSFYCNRHIGSLLENLRDKGISVTYSQFIHKSIQNDNLTDYNLSKKDISVAPLNVDYQNRFRIGNYLASVFLLIRLLQKNDVVYIFWPGQLGKIAGILSRLFRKRYGLYLRGDFRIDRISRFILEESEFCLSVSQYFTEKVHDFCNNVYAEPPLMDISIADIYKERPKYSNELKHFLFVGRIEHAKGSIELVDSFLSMISEGFDFHLHLVGGGELYSILKEKVMRDKVGHNRIHLLGMISDKKQLMNLYRTSDAFIIPSHTEGFPRVIYEAMAAKMAIFTTFVGGIPYLMKDRVNCIEIPVKNSLGIANIIKNSYRSSELLNMVSENAMHEFCKLLNSDNKDHASLIHEIITIDHPIVK